MKKVITKIKDLIINSGKREMILSLSCILIVMAIAGVIIARSIPTIPTDNNDMTSSEYSELASQLESMLEESEEPDPTDEPSSESSEESSTESSEEPDHECEDDCCESSDTSSTVEPTEEPTKKPVATAEPTKKPVATAEPTKAPVVTVAPTKAPIATVEPTKAPVATVEPTKEPVSTPKPSPEYSLGFQRAIERGCDYCGTNTCAAYDYVNGIYTHKNCPKYDEKKDPSKWCPVCGKPAGDGQNGTCCRPPWDATCYNCGESVKAGECHTCKK